MNKLKKSKKVIGLTGGFGTGKSTVAEMFKAQGCRVIDADRIGRELIAPGGAAYKEIIRVFGGGIAAKDGRINRAKLGRIVFADRKVLERFNRIMHPRIIAEMKRQIKDAKEDVVVLDAPLLLETGLDRSVDVIVVVRASLDNQIKRLRKRTGLSTPQIIARIQSQLPLQKKLGLADFVIDNNGTIQDTRKQVALIRRV